MRQNHGSSVPQREATVEVALLAECLDIMAVAALVSTPDSAVASLLVDLVLAVARFTLPTFVLSLSHPAPSSCP